MFQDTADLAALAEVLSQSTDYRVLRRLVPRAMCPPDIGQETKVGILIDTETTGLDHARDEVIELGTRPRRRRRGRYPRNPQA
ncbi:DNA polymerase III epsilon subunit-like protein [Bradyrhizobium sp. GM0.4]